MIFSVGVYFSSIVMCMYLTYFKFSRAESVVEFLHSGTFLVNIYYVIILLILMWTGNEIAKEVLSILNSFTLDICFIFRYLFQGKQTGVMIHKALLKCKSEATETKVNYWIRIHLNVFIILIQIFLGPADAVLLPTGTSFTGRQLWAICGWLDAFVLGILILLRILLSCSSKNIISFLPFRNADDWRGNNVPNNSH